MVWFASAYHCHGPVRKTSARSSASWHSGASHLLTIISKTQLFSRASVTVVPHVAFTLLIVLLFLLMLERPRGIERMYAVMIELMRAVKIIIDANDSSLLVVTGVSLTFGGVFSSSLINFKYSFCGAWVVKACTSLRNGLNLLVPWFFDQFDFNLPRHSSLSLIYDRVAYFFLDNN